jgi:hypothetical protein
MLTGWIKQVHDLMSVQAETFERPTILLARYIVEHMLTYADVCCRMLSYARAPHYLARQVLSGAYADVC